MQDYRQAIIARKASGHIIINGNDVAETSKCCHCQHQWVVVKDSGIERGFCMRCYAPTCGKPTCDPCYPFEKKLDDYEKGRLHYL